MTEENMAHLHTYTYLFLQGKRHEGHEVKKDDTNDWHYFSAHDIYAVQNRIQH